MDLQTEQAVWRRVKGPGAVTAEEALLPERLEALILQEQADAAALRGLSRRMNGPESAALSRIAAAADSRAKELTALHSLLTGRRLRMKVPPVRNSGPVPEALREICLRMEQTAKAYKSLETEFADRAELFSRYARDSRDQARTLLSQLKNHLPRQADLPKNSFPLK